MAATAIVTASNSGEVIKKQKALQFIANNSSLQEIQRLEELARSPKARAMLNENWAMLHSMI